MMVQQTDRYMQAFIGVMFAAQKREMIMEEYREEYREELMKEIMLKTDNVYKWLSQLRDWRT